MTGKEFSEELTKLGWYMEGGKHISWVHNDYPDWFILRGYFERAGWFCYTKGEPDETGFSTEDFSISSIEEVKKFMKTHKS